MKSDGIHMCSNTFKLDTNNEGGDSMRSSIQSMSSNSAVKEPHLTVSVNCDIQIRAPKIQIQME